MAALDTLFREAGLMPVAHFDVLQTESSTQGPRTDIGQVAWARDKFGRLRMYTYRKNVSGSAMALGDLASRTREVETNITAGSTTTATGTFNTADTETGGIVVVHDDAGAAGAAPEGEASVILSQSATLITVESEIPFSTALAVNDDITILGQHVIDAAANDIAFAVAGVSMSAPADGGFGWFQFQGLHPGARHAASTFIAGDALKAGTAAVDVYGAATAVVGGTAGTGIWYIIGAQFAIHTSDVVTTRSPVVMALLPMYM